CLVGRISSLLSKKAFSSIELVLEYEFVLRVFAFDFAIVEEVLFFLCLRGFVVWMFELISLFDSCLNIVILREGNCWFLECSRIIAIKNIVLNFCRNCIFMDAINCLLAKR
ncbi:hypothetical protein BpHYR1_005776, partial [Brachionus plicatilis]